MSDPKPRVPLQDVKDLVSALARLVENHVGDEEQWHAYEDEIVQDVLRIIAEGRCLDAPPEDFAAEALKACDLEFSRWYA